MDINKILDLAERYIFFVLAVFNAILGVIDLVEGIRKKSPLTAATGVLLCAVSGAYTFLGIRDLRKDAEEWECDCL